MTKDPSRCSQDISLWTKEAEQLTLPSLEPYHKHGNKHFEYKCRLKPMEIWDIWYMI